MIELYKDFPLISLWQHGQKKDFSFLFFFGEFSFLLGQLTCPLLNEAFQSGRVLFHDSQHVVENIRAPEMSRLMRKERCHINCLAETASKPRSLLFEQFPDVLKRMKTKCLVHDYIYLVQ